MDGTPALESLAPLDEAGGRDIIERHGALDGIDLLRVMITRELPGRIALVSSFGAESAVLLDMVARIDPATPVIFLDTGKLFPETLAYRQKLATHLGLSDVRDVRPEPDDISRVDPDGTLWRNDLDACCMARKEVPLERALGDLEAWITGRKRFQSGLRSTIPTLEWLDGRLKINPLADWTQGDLSTYANARGLPPHPLVAEGYLSIGCAHCTRAVLPGEAARAGRWAGTDKTECGIHDANWARQA